MRVVVTRIRDGEQLGLFEMDYLPRKGELLEIPRTEGTINCRIEQIQHKFGSFGLYATLMVITY